MPLVPSARLQAFREARAAGSSSYLPPGAYLAKATIPQEVLLRRQEWWTPSSSGSSVIARITFVVEEGEGGDKTHRGKEITQIYNTTDYGLRVIKRDFAAILGVPPAEMERLAEELEPSALHGKRCVIVVEDDPGARDQNGEPVRRSRVQLVRAASTWQSEPRAEEAPAPAQPAWGGPRLPDIDDYAVEDEDDEDIGGIGAVR